MQPIFSICYLEGSSSSDKKVDVNMDPICSLYGKHMEKW